jgi:hypothetical protein
MYVLWSIWVFSQQLHCSEAIAPSPFNNFNGRCPIAHLCSAKNYQFCGLTKARVVHWYLWLFVVLHCTKQWGMSRSKRETNLQLFWGADEICQLFYAAKKTWQSKVFNLVFNEDFQMGSAIFVPFLRKAMSFVLMCNFKVLFTFKLAPQ